jgi:hypothetical protein
MVALAKRQERTSVLDVYTTAEATSEKARMAPIRLLLAAPKRYLRK